MVGSAAAFAGSPCSGKGWMGLALRGGIASMMWVPLSSTWHAWHLTRIPPPPPPPRRSRLFASHTGDCLRSMIPEPHENPCPPVTSARFTPNYKYALVTTLSSKLQLWDPQLRGWGPARPGGAGNGVKKTYTGHLNRRYSLIPAFLVNMPTGTRYIAVGSEDHHVYLYDLNRRSVAGLLRGRASASDAGDGHCDTVFCVDSSRSQAMLASAGGARDRTVKLWRYSGAEGGGQPGAATAMQSEGGGLHLHSGVSLM